MLLFENNEFKGISFTEFLRDMPRFADKQIVIVEPLAPTELQTGVFVNPSEHFDVESCLYRMKQTFTFRPFQSSQFGIWIHTPNQSNLAKLSALLGKVDLAKFHSSSVVRASDLFGPCNFRSFTSALSEKLPAKRGFKVAIGNNSIQNDKLPEQDCAEIIPGLFVGNERAATNQKLITQLNVQRIVAVGLGLSSVTIDTIERYTVDLDDSVFADLDRQFWDAAEYVKESIDHGLSVLAHCRKGLSRSPALCVAVLMKRGMSFEDALALVKSKRPQIAINPGFLRQLQMRQFEDCLSQPRAKTRLAPILVA